MKHVAHNAVRIQYVTDEVTNNPLPDWLYVKHNEVKNCLLSVKADDRRGCIEVKYHQGKVIFRATKHQLESKTVAGELTHDAMLSFASPKDEYLFGLGQFQDGYTNVRGLSRRLTQVNTQASIPMLISSKGYGVLWNNYGLTDFNPCDHSVALTRQEGQGSQEMVNVTSTDGNKQEIRQRYQFVGTLEAVEDGDYALLLDVGQKMALRHNLFIDRATVIE
ncbi:MAG: glycosyl hydrolase family 31, partial [Prevotella sp.]|nr:glycosyl hydrolase family 31 [Prevotella sp.]